MKYPDHIEHRIEYFTSSFYLANKSLSTLNVIINELESTREHNIVKSEPFRFFQVTLQYCFINEYCKLLERTKNKRINQNYASIWTFLEVCHSELPESHPAQDKKWLEQLNEIASSEMSEELRVLRDKQISHIDKEGKPRQIYHINKTQVKEAFILLNKVNDIIESLTSFYFRIPHHDTTENFIRYQSKYKQEHFNKK